MKKILALLSVIALVALTSCGQTKTTTPVAEEVTPVETEAPAADAMETEAPAADAMETEAPAADAMKTEAPAADAMETEAPAAEEVK